MWNKFLPNKMAKNVYEITPKYLQEHGIKGLITDLDNTLIRWDAHDALPELKVWFKELIDENIAVVVCSNNSEARVKAFAEKVSLPFVAKAKKPLTSGFKRALKLMNLQSSEVAVIGDQLMTDVFGGNRCGCHTILVEPLVYTDEWKTYLNRRMEKVILKYFRKTNQLSEEKHGK